uniref:EGF-like domain-containing protein n=2 Tax=Cuerna arida TaxID=1464854 RepID=A0A1B6ENI4_9HEMI
MRVITVFCILVICYRADGVDILIANDYGVESFASSEHSFQSLVLSSAPVPTVDYHYQRKEAYAAWDSRIYRFPLYNNDSSWSFGPTSVANITLCWSFAVDWVHNHVFWPDCGDNAAIMMSDLDGGNITMILLLSQNHPMFISDIAIDPYRGLLFWISDGSLFSCELDGREATNVATLAFTETANIVLDMVAKRIYLLGHKNSSNLIYYLEYHSSEPRLIHKADGKIWSFSVYESQLYLCYDSANYTYLTTRSVADDTAPEHRLSNLSKKIWHMKVIDPELQTPPEIDQCTSKGCSHHCVVQKSLGLCRCPTNFRLGLDKRTCEVIEHKDDTFLNVLEGIACVVFVLLAAGILMCLCDKVWSNIHPTVVRVTSSSTRYIYKDSDLSENLI